MTVVDLTGKPIAEAPPDREDLVTVLSGILASIKAGEIRPEGFYLILDIGATIKSFDSGLTIAQGVHMLEREKFCILCAAEGVKL